MNYTKNTVLHILILVLISGFLFLFCLGNMPLTDPDETFYAQTAKEMISKGEWVTPHIFGKPQFEKPIFYYWLIELSYKIFGINEFAARFPSAIFGILGILGIYFIGRLIFSPLCGLLSGLVMATSVAYLAISRACVTDMVLTVFILLCLMFFMYGWQREKKFYYFFAAAMAAFAVLTKGPIGLFLPGMVILAYWVTGKRWRELKKVPFFLSILIFLIISLPWYLLVTKIHGSTFISEFLGFQNVTRFLVPEHRIGISPFFYVPVVFGGIFPWTLFLIFAVWLFYREDNSVSKFSGYKLFLAAWFLIVFGFFSISRTKLVTYILPLFPVLAIFVGRFWDKCIAGDEEVNSRKIISNVYGFLSLASMVGVVVANIIVKRRYGSDIAVPVIVAGAIFVILLSVSYIFFLKKKMYIAFSSVIVAMIMVAFVSAFFIIPPIAKLESSKYLAELVKEKASPDEPIGGECDGRRGVAFYSGRVDIVDVHPYPDLIKFVSRKDRVWAIIQKKHYKQLKEQHKDLYTEVIDSSGKYVLITNKKEGKN